MVQLQLLLGLAFGSLFASFAIAGPVNVAMQRREIPKGFTCGCLTECMIACPDIRVCLCPPQPCIEKYLCPTKTVKPTVKTTITLRPTTTHTITLKPSTTKKPVPTKTTVLPPGFTCGCITQCEIDCGENLPACSCPSPQTCLPQYLCKTSTTKKPTPTPKPTTTKKPVPCGCTNDCFVNCPKPGTCICTLECDPKYACKE